VTAARRPSKEFVGRVNAAWAGGGLPALAVDGLLTTTARAHCGEMDARGCFSHRSPAPGLTTPLERAPAGPRGRGGPMPCALLVGENIYYCGVSSDIYNVDHGHRALMSSAGRRANILDPRFSRIGGGGCRDARGRFWVTEMFLGEGAPGGRAGGAQASVVAHMTLLW